MIRYSRENTAERAGVEADVVAPCEHELLGGHARGDTGAAVGDELAGGACVCRQRLVERCVDCARDAPCDGVQGLLVPEPARVPPHAAYDLDDDEDDTDETGPPELD